MGRESLKEKAEQWLAQAARAGGMLPPGIQIVHAESGEHAKSERIIVEATVGEQQLEGPKGFEVEVEIELRSTNRNAEQIDDVFTAIERSLAKPGALALAKQLFTVLEWFPEKTSGAGNRGKNTRNRWRKLVFVMVEKGLAVADSR